LGNDEARRGDLVPVEGKTDLGERPILLPAASQSG